MPVKAHQHAAAVHSCCKTVLPCRARVGNTGVFVVQWGLAWCVTVHWGSAPRIGVPGYTVRFQEQLRKRFQEQLSTLASATPAVLNLEDNAGARE
jgi:hypothetical protein